MVIDGIVGKCRVKQGMKWNGKWKTNDLPF